MSTVTVTTVIENKEHKASRKKDAASERQLRITNAIQRNEELVKDLKDMSSKLMKAVREGNMADTQVYIKENVDLYKEVARKVRSVHKTLRAAMDINGDGVIDKKDFSCCLSC